ncbi:MAG TPA: histidine--tRNA ligase [Candidatus Saccharimonadales bacterium]
MALAVQPYKGTRDFYPPDERIQKWMFNKWREIVEKYGYEEYNAPILELMELYRAKSGEEIAEQQTYNFTDRGGREVAIRPEMTPTVSRMVAGQRQELAYPLRWYSIPNLWRYERPQRGRSREHWQLNVDIFGVDKIDAELELIMIAADIMRSFGASDDMYQIRINSRKLMDLIFTDYLELDVVQANLMAKLFDRQDKMPEDAFYREAAGIFDNEQSNQKLRKLIEAKSLADLPESVVQSKAMRQVQLLFTLLKESNIKNARFDVSLMRGFDYYTDIVFEIYDSDETNNRSIFGGGRYDGMVGLFGVENLPTAGFGLGDVTLHDFLETHRLLPELNSETDVYLVVIGDVLRQANGVAGLLRNEGVNVAVDVTGRDVDKQIKAAVKKQIHFALFVGEQELAAEQFTLKDLESGTEDKHSIERIVSILKDEREK